MVAKQATGFCANRQELIATYFNPLDISFKQDGDDVVLTISGEYFSNGNSYTAYLPGQGPVLKAYPPTAECTIDSRDGTIEVLAMKGGTYSSWYHDSNTRNLNFPMLKRLETTKGEYVSGDIGLSAQNGKVTLYFAPGGECNAKIIFRNQTLIEMGLVPGDGRWKFNTGNPSLDRATWSVSVESQK